MEYRPILYDTIKKFAHEKRISFHMPVHNGGKLYEKNMQALLQLDMTELDATDNLACPTGVLAQTHQNMAHLFGADNAHLLVGGSSAGIHAMLLSCLVRGDMVLVDRCVHQSVLNACALYGFTPVFFEREVLPGFSVPGSIQPKSLQHAIDTYPHAKAILITTPTYYGICADVPALAQMAHAHNMALLVDSAHGSHFAFSDALPNIAVTEGADLCVLSLHKTLGAPTQTALLLHRSSTIPFHRVKTYLNMVQTTSPSYILMCCADYVCAKMTQEGEALFAHAIAMTQYIKSQLEQDSYIRCLPEEGGDPTRLVIHLSAYALTGYQVAAQLAQQYGIDIEMADLYNLVCIVGPLVTKADADALIQAVRKIVSTAKMANCSATLPPLPQICPAVSLCDAMAAKTVQLTLTESLDRISAVTVSVYPPGVPCLIPGARITAETLAYLNTVLGSGGTATGIEDGTICVFA